MVKYAEAEKRRGGDGCDRRMAPVMMLERTKISRGTWESLKAHIIRERRKKKEEQEADAEEERLRKERENRKKQHAMTLEETREQISQKERDLSDLKREKHQLFQKLKTVLNEDENRKRQQQNYNRENELMAVHPYPPGTIPIGSHPQMLFQSNLLPGRPGAIPTLYKVGIPPSQQQTLLSSGTVKRARSPSPPAATYQPIPYNFKSLAAQPVPVTLSTTKTGSPASAVYVTGGQSSYYHSTTQPHGSSSQYPPTSQAAAVAAVAAAAFLPHGAGPPTLSNPSPATQAPPPPTREDKHLTSGYMQPGRPAHVTSLHQTLDHTKAKAPTGFAPPPPEAGEKFFAPGVRPHMSLHSGVLPPGGAKGSISSSYSVRAPPPPPPPSSQPPPPTSSSAPHSYSSQPPYSRPYY